MCEYGPFAEHVHGITYDGSHVWAALGPKLVAFDPGTGKPTRTLDRVGDAGTAFDWVDGELWHGTWEGDESEIRRVDPESGAVLERLKMPRDAGASGLEYDGVDTFYCGGGASGKVRAVRRSK